MTDHGSSAHAIDIRERAPYPANVLSNLAANPFVVRGMAVASMEGLLQGLKHSSPREQRRVFSLAGQVARKAGGSAWRATGMLHWQGHPFPREGREHQQLLDEAYEALFATNGEARQALLATGEALLTHELGRTDPRETVLTVPEFCTRLMRIRATMQGEAASTDAVRRLLRREARAFVVGDVHGCFDELTRLLERAALDEQDWVIAAGDVIDRGPASVEVLAFLRQRPNTIVISGNHERKHVHSAAGSIDPALSQVITREQFGDSYEEACEFMAFLPYAIELDDAIVVHAYLEPDVALAEQRQTILAGTMSGQRHLRLRYDRPWYEYYDGEKPVIVGHRTYNRDRTPFVYRDRVFGIDTACCRGGALTGVLLPDFELVSVPSRGDYWSQIKVARRAHTGATTDGDQAFELLLTDAIAEHDLIVRELERDPTFAQRPRREQDRDFARAVGKHELASLIFAHRHGKLSREYVARRLRSRRAAIELAAHRGLDITGVRPR